MKLIELSRTIALTMAAMAFGITLFVVQPLTCSISLPSTFGRGR